MVHRGKDIAIRSSLRCVILTPLNRNESKDVRQLAIFCSDICSDLHQTDIVRILFMVPIYASVSTASYLFWVCSPHYWSFSLVHLLHSAVQQDQSTPLLLVRDCYESTVLTSFFYLLLMYVSHDEQEQKEVFRKVSCFNGLLYFCSLILVCTSRLD